VTERYVAWLNDPDINQFLESRFESQTTESVVEYVGQIIRNPDYRMFAIVLTGSDLHIGNIKLGPINHQHRRAEIGIMIGERAESGKGYATLAIKLMTDYAFRTLKLHKVHAGAYAPNKGSIRAFEKVGFMIEGVAREHCLFNGAFVDVVSLGKLNPSA
jgi:RimJ/RimL family protein N-acetyltransferase